MGTDLAIDYFAGSQGMGSFARHELSAIIAIRTWLLADVLVLHGGLGEFCLGG
jgi:hypothetical protein